MYDYFKSTAKERMSQEFWLKSIGEIRHYFVEEIDQNESMSKQ